MYKLLARVTLFWGVTAFFSLLIWTPSSLAQGSAEHGKQIFEKATCVVCHPGGGNTVNPQEPLKGQKFAREFADDESIAKVIRNGIKGTPMPAFGKDKISDADLKDLIAYIRSLTPGSNR